MHAATTRIRPSRALVGAQRRLVAIACVPVLATAACGGSTVTGQRDSGDGGTSPAPSGNDDAGMADRMDPGQRCGDTPVRLVDYAPDVPNREQNAIQVPNIGVNSAGLFYLLNWNTPLGAPEGPGGYVMHLPDGATEPIRLATVVGGGSGSRQGLAVTQTAAIFGQAPDGGDGPGAVLSVSPGGEEPTMLTSTMGLAHAVVSDEQNVYFVDGEGTKSVPLTGGPVRMLASQTSVSIMVAGSTLYLGELGPTGSLSSVPIDGGPVTVLVAESALQPTLCGQSVCWMNGTLNADLRRLAPGGSPTTLAGGLNKPHDLVFDGRHFFVTMGFGGLYRIPAGGGELVGVQPGELTSNLALHEACLYWSEASGIYSWALSAASQGP